jgi:hypothetical protein
LSANRDRLDPSRRGADFLGADSYSRLAPAVTPVQSAYGAGMAPENPNHPLPDQIPDDDRTGNEPNPSGKSPKQPSDHPNAPRASCRQRNAT